MKIINNTRKGSRKHAIKFNEQYDWFTDDTSEEMRDYQSDQENDFEMVNWEANEEELPVFAVDEADEGAGGILVDDIGEEPQVEMPLETEIVDESVEEETEIDARVPDFTSTRQAVQWAVKNSRVMEIFYVTQGKNRGRGGLRLKREVGLPKEEKGGVNIHRIVEPHYVYQAGNGNTIVVTYDRSVRHIRAFIIDNIYDYNFTKNRKTKKDQYFRPRMRVMPRSDKGIKTMKNVKDKLTKIASALDDKGLKKSSSVVRDAIKAAANYKTAQYVGVQGYWLKNRRCWDNCYRHKRTAQPGTPAQEVWMECWDEYKDSINNSKSSWAKYAEGDAEIKVSDEDEQSWNKIFADRVEEKVKEGMHRPIAIYDVIEAESQKYAQKIIEASSDLMTLADTLSANGNEAIGKEMADVAVEMLKEADFGGGWWDKTKDFFRSKGGKVAERLNRLIQKINQIMVNIQGNVASAEASPAIKVAQLPTGTPSVAPTAPQPAMPQNLNSAQVALYGQFLSDIRQEMGYLFKMQTKTPDIMNVTQPAIQAMGQFLTTSDKLFQSTGKKTFNREQVMVALSNLLNAVTGASASIAPNVSAAPISATPGELPSAPSGAPTAGPKPADIAVSVRNSPGGQELIQRIQGNQVTKADLDFLVSAFEQNNLPLNSANWVEFNHMLNAPI